MLRPFTLVASVSAHEHTACLLPDTTLPWRSRAEKDLCSVSTGESGYEDADIPSSERRRLSGRVNLVGHSVDFAPSLSYTSEGAINPYGRILGND